MGQDFHPQLKPWAKLIVFRLVCFCVLANALYESNQLES